MAAIVLGYVVLDAINCAFLGAGFVGGARGVGVEADGTVAPERRGVHAALTAVGVLLVAAMGVRVLLTVSIAAYLRVSEGVDFARTALGVDYLFLVPCRGF